MARTQPPQQPPPVMKLLVKYGKIGAARFGSHRDYARALERGLRRASVPMAYSSGFSPHPRISYINPAPTGVMSFAEYVVLGVREVVDPYSVRQRLNASMPTGFPVLEVTEFRGDEFPASLWRVHLDSVTPEQWQAAIAALHARKTEIMAGSLGSQEKGAPGLFVSRETKNGIRTFDVLGPLEWVDLIDGEDLGLVITHTEPLVRPDDVITALRSICPDLGDFPPLITRLAQGTPDKVSQKSRVR